MGMRSNNSIKYIVFFKIWVKLNMNIFSELIICNGGVNIVYQHLL